MEISHRGTYVCVEIRKNLNIGSLIRCCVAFGCTGIILIGSTEYYSFGSHGSQQHLCYYHFYNWHDFLVYVQTRNIGYHVIPNSKLGSERTVDSIKIENVTFTVADIMMFVVEDTYAIPPEVQVNCTSAIAVIAPNAVMNDKIDYTAKVAVVLQYHAAMVGASANQFHNEKFIVSKSDLKNSKVITLSESAHANADAESVEDITNDAMSTLFGEEDD